MPKPKPNQKQKAKLKGKAQPQTPSVTAKKSYWMVLAVLFAVVSVVFGVTMGLSMNQTVILVITIVTLIGVIGFIRVSPSNLSLSKRGTFIFAGASIIGFSIWAAITLSGLMTPVAQTSGEVFTAVTSFAICLTVGAFIGEMLGRIKKIQDQLFLGLKN